MLQSLTHFKLMSDFKLFIKKTLAASRGLPIQTENKLALGKLNEFQTFENLSTKATVKKKKTSDKLGLHLDI